MPYEEVELSRDVEAVMIPQGVTTLLKAGTPAVITQALGDSYTIQVPTFGGLYRISGTDADAIGKAAARSDGEPGADLDAPVTEDLVYSQLRHVYDPEIPVNIVDLGLVYACTLSPLPEGGQKIDVKFTLTAPGCGMGDVLREDIKGKLLTVPDIKEADVQVVFDPPWSLQMMSEAAKLQLGMM